MTECILFIISSYSADEEVQLCPQMNLTQFTGFAIWAIPLLAQQSDPVVKKDGLSIHTVERGSMPLFGSARGSLSSLQPARALLRLENSRERCEPGRAAKLVFGANSRAFLGKVVHREGSRDPSECEVEFREALPEGAAVGSRVEALVEVGEMKDVVFFARPAASLANSAAVVFVLDGTAASARRTTVRYGVRSGPLIQILDGLAPGDKVIVTDMSRWADAPRVRLE